MKNYNYWDICHLLIYSSCRKGFDHSRARYALLLFEEEYYKRTGTFIYDNQVSETKISVDRDGIPFFPKEFHYYPDPAAGLYEYLVGTVLLECVESAVTAANPKKVLGRPYLKSRIHGSRAYYYYLPLSSIADYLKKRR